MSHGIKASASNPPKVEESADLSKREGVLGEVKPASASIRPVVTYDFKHPNRFDS